MQYPSAVRRWQDIADFIGMDQSEIADIEDAHPGQPMHQLHLALLRALHTYSDNYENYVEQLGKALRRVHAYDVASKCVIVDCRSTTVASESRSGSRSGNLYVKAKVWAHLQTKQ